MLSIIYLHCLSNPRSLCHLYIMNFQCQYDKTSWIYSTTVILCTRVDNISATSDLPMKTFSTHVFTTCGDTFLIRAINIIELFSRYFLLFVKKIVAYLSCRSDRSRILKWSQRDVRANCWI